MAVTHTENNKRIAKNTAMLYVRMFFIMAITFYTSRVVLQVLGVEDYGIYNVVGGVAAMFGFINGSLSGASSRFITFSLGKGDEKELCRVFNCVVTIHYLIAVMILIIAETFGLWFVMTQLVIPPERMEAALWVYQSAMLSMVIMLTSTPFNALIIAHERMSVFAYISVFEVIAQLGIVLLLFTLPFDKLEAYAVLIVMVQITVRVIYIGYCRHNFFESHYRLQWDKKYLREIFSYAGWTLSGNLAVVCYTQGVNVLLNLFFGPVVNAARGIAVQVQAGLMRFFSNFQTAVTPQITKSYAVNDLVYMHKLVLSSSRYSFYLMLLVSLPVLLETEYILQLWLGEVPDHTVSFVRILIFASMNYPLSGPTVIAIHATGDIKKFQLIEGGLLLTVVPVAFLLLKFMHISAEMVLVTYLFIETVTQFVRVWIVYPYIGLPKHKYLTKVLWPIIKVSAFSWILPVLTQIGGLSGFASLFVVTIVSILSTVFCVYMFGMSHNERLLAREKVLAISHKVLKQ